MAIRKEMDLQHIVIIGAGLAGLTLAIRLRQNGFEATVLERNSEIDEIGAGIQIPANCSRVLDDLGVLTIIRAKGVCPEELRIRSYRGRDLYRQPLNPSIEKSFGQPHILIHRSELRRVLYETACKLGAEVHLNANVRGLDVEAGIVTLENGDTVAGDLLVAADGQHSLCRKVLTGTTYIPRSCGDMAYRIAVPVVQMRERPEMAVLLDGSNIHVWCGPRSHAVCYCLREDSIFNIVLFLPDQALAPVKGEVTNIEDVREYCKDWDTIFQSLLKLADRCVRWTLLQPDEQSTWHYGERGSAVLIGDAVHATLPSLAQGAAMAIESAFCLADVLKLYPQRYLLPATLRIFTDMRLSRVRQIKEESDLMQATWQLEDGEGQQARDRRFENTSQPDHTFPLPLARPCWQARVWDYRISDELDRLKAIHDVVRGPVADGSALAR